MRKLASVQEVRELRPIPNADFIELAIVQGWQAVVKRGQFAVGDKAIYFEIDSVFPDIEVFRFLWKGYDTRPEKHRLKTARLRGELSQGLLMTPQELGFDPDALELGQDLSEMLGITKYDPPIPMDTGANVIGPFISDVSKTDEERIQSSLWQLDALRGLPYYITEKLDGTSVTYGFYDGEFRVCNRNRRVDEHSDYARVMPEGLPQMLGNRYVIQGEICGPGVQKNPLGLKRPEVFFFNLWDRTKHGYADFFALRFFCEYHGLHMVPVLEEGESFNYTLQELLEKAQGTYASGKQREGIVIRPRKEVRMPNGSRLSFKVLNNIFLLKETD